MVDDETNQSQVADPVPEAELAPLVLSESVEAGVRSGAQKSLADDLDVRDRKHFWILGIPVLLFCIVSFFLWNDFQEDVIGRKEKGIATIRVVEGTARRRPLDRFRWFIASPNRSVSVNESILTEKDSKVILEFEGGTEIEVGETSLITVQQKKGQIALNLKGGQIRFKSAPKAKKQPLLQVQGKTVAIENSRGEARGVIGIRENSASITVESGNVSLSEGNKTESLKVNQSLQISVDGTRQIIQPGIKLNAPASGQVFIADSPKRKTTPVEFSWDRSKLRSILPLDLSLEISTTPDFSRVWQSFRVHGAAAKSGFPAGTYYWRIRLSPQAVSEAQAFKVLERQAVELLEPEDGINVAKENADVDTLFAWEPQADAQGYTLRISTDPQFSNVIQEVRVEEQNRAFVNLKGQKRVYWKVESHFASAQLDSESPVRILNIEYQSRNIVETHPEPKALVPAEVKSVTQATPPVGKAVPTSDVKLKTTPKLQAAAPAPSLAISSGLTAKPALPKAVLLTFSDIDLKIGGLRLINNQRKVAGGPHPLGLSLSWNSNPGASSYVVQFSRNKYFKPIEFQKRVSSKELALDAASFPKHPGFFRILGVTTQNEKPSSSGPIPFRFNFLPPLPKSPADHASYSLKSLAAEGAGIFILTWSQTLFSDYYLYEIATDAGFKRVIERGKIPENFVMFRHMTLGTYWWRVRSGSKYFESPPNRALQFTFK